MDGSPAMKEFCFNLWYHLDREQNITAIAAKAYLLDGDDDDKASALMSSSVEDYRNLTFLKLKAVNYSVLGVVGVEEFFTNEFERIRRELPKGNVLPEDKLFYATPLFDFGQGFVPAEIGNGYVRERR
jgi:hypothetical protein